MLVVFSLTALFRRGNAGQELPKTNKNENSDNRDNVFQPFGKTNEFLERIHAFPSFDNLLVLIPVFGMRFKYRHPVDDPLEEYQAKCDYGYGDDYLRPCRNVSIRRIPPEGYDGHIQAVHYYAYHRDYGGEAYQRHVPSPRGIQEEETWQCHKAEHLNHEPVS